MRPETVKRTWLPNMHHHIVDVDAALNVNVNVDADDDDDNDEQQQQQQACPPDFVNVLGKASLIMIDHNHRWVVVVLEWFFLFLVVSLPWKYFIYTCQYLTYISTLSWRLFFLLFLITKHYMFSNNCFWLSLPSNIYILSILHILFSSWYSLYSLFLITKTQNTHTIIYHIYTCRTRLEAAAVLSQNFLRHDHSVIILIHDFPAGRTIKEWKTIMSGNGFELLYEGLRHHLASTLATFRRLPTKERKK